MENQTKDISSIKRWEEAANIITHGFGFFLSIFGLFWMVTIAQATGDPWKIGSSSIFGISLVLLFAASTLYHACQDIHLKLRFRLVDHCAIYALIAGSYTPFTLVTLYGPWGIALFTTVWSLAFLGIFVKIYFFNRWQKLSVLFYVAMGWMVLIALEPLLLSLPLECIYLIGLGGFFYTFGAFVYVLKKPLFYHAIWHLFVLGGSACHYFAILYYVL